MRVFATTTPRNRATKKTLTCTNRSPGQYEYNRVNFSQKVKHLKQKFQNSIGSGKSSKQAYHQKGKYSRESSINGERSLNSGKYHTEKHKGTIESK